MMFDSPASCAATGDDAVQPEEILRAVSGVRQLVEVSGSFYREAPASASVRAYSGVHRD